MYTLLICCWTLTWDVLHGAECKGLLDLVLLPNLLPRGTKVGLHHALHVVSNDHLHILKLKKPTWDEIGIHPSNPSLTGPLCSGCVVMATGVMATRSGPHFPFNQHQVAMAKRKIELIHLSKDQHRVLLRKAPPTQQQTHTLTYSPRIHQHSPRHHQVLQWQGHSPSQ